MVKRRLKIKNVIILIITLIFLTIFIISTIKIIEWHLDNKEAKDLMEDVNQIVEIKKVEPTPTPSIEPPIDEPIPTSVPEPTPTPEFNPYWDYVDTNLIDVNISELKQVNDEIVGWIQVEGTRINYPFVQHSDNKFYLNHTLNKRYNTGGWVFLDYRNNLSNQDKNTILYAHARGNKTMFGPLNSILNSKWIQNKNNYIIRLSTEHENTVWQIFSVYYIKETSDYIETNFDTDKEYEDFLKKIKDRSEYNFETEVNTTDRIITLSTCHSDTERTVVHAKLIKKN